MIYSEPLFNQISRFVSSIGFGFILCIVYLAVTFLRLCISDKKWAVITGDLLFGITGTVLSFFFMVIHNNGQVRLNLVVGQALGGVVLYAGFGRYFVKLLKKPALLIRKGCHLITMPIKLYILAFPKALRMLIRSLKEKNKTEKKIKKDKTKKTAKKFKIKSNYCKNTIEKSK